VLTAGLEIGSRELVVSMNGACNRFSNDAEGHRKLLRYVTSQGSVRVCLEATGNYHLDVALALHRDDRVQVQVLNPWVARRFAEARLQRAKTDRVDAEALAEYAARMPHEEWRAPSEAALGLRAITRRMQQLADRKSSEGSRLHAASISQSLPAVVVQSVQEELAHLDAQLAVLQREARAVGRSDGELEQLLELLLTIPGIGERSALYLLGELGPLGCGMSARQLVAHAGLDPRPVESGTSVHKPRRISKRGNSRLRHILYMTALAAAHHDAHFGAFYAALQQRQKSKRAALVAVMRKQLHAICGVWRSSTAYDGTRLFPRMQLVSKS
jgi:transposase